MKPIIQHYLLTSEGERRVSILTSKSTLHPPSINVHILGEKTSQKGVIEWYSTNSTIPDNTSRILLDSSSVIIANNQGDTLSGNCVTKQLHINDADEKRKRVEVLVKLQLGNGAYLGTFHSKGIKVISKPSKKRQSVKNMELCIHHGTTVSLFNRIRSQTVSTKYLGVLTNGSASRKDSGTCFVARTNSWDPFVIWIVDTTHSDQSRESLKNNHHPINPHYPAPPAIALKTTPKQAPIALHYNQPVVLQCVRTGLVSPIMVIRKVDKGSMVLGGNRIDDLSGVTGGEFGDEALGDPVSQLHKVAFQIVNDQHSPDSNKTAYKTTPYHTEWLLPQKSSNNISYLACLNDVVGMHKTTNPRTIVEEGKITRKRRVSCDVIKSSALPTKFQSSITTKNNRHRVNSLTETHVPIKTEGAGRRSSTSTFTDRRCSVSSNTGMYQMNGACWIEDVSDAAIWTIVGTNCATYKFYTPPSKTHSRLNSPFTNHQNSSPITPFPVLSSSSNYTANSKGILNLMGENLTRDISVWFGDIKSRRTDYKSREYISCVIPELDELMRSPVSTVDKDKPSKHRIPLLFVRGDGIIYRTDLFYIY
ncbi:beta-trefoil DNA-binding domain-containing protein [Pilobolus umbonatus]|nr:beta-trefoil DNA-binding domain-containing protein [Pilobolus umbonatus]